MSTRVTRPTAAPIRMPYGCPACRKTLYSTSSSRPAAGATRRAKFLYVAAGTVTSLTYLVILVVLRELLKRPIGPVLGTDEVILYHVPPTWLLSVVALPVALIPGFAIGWVAARLSHVRQLRCWNCGWSAAFPAGAAWADPPPERTPASRPAGFEVVADDANPWKECTAWAYAEIRQGRLPEDVEADLIAQGWPPDDVAGMIEQCRKEARGGRG